VVGAGRQGSGALGSRHARAQGMGRVRMADRIERIELWHVNVPLPAPFWPSWSPG